MILHQKLTFKTLGNVKENWKGENLGAPSFNAMKNLNFSLKLNIVYMTIRHN